MNDEMIKYNKKCWTWTSETYC